MPSETTSDDVWLDIRWFFYPRLVEEEVAEQFDPEIVVISKHLPCVHRRALVEPCVACEGLSILSGTRR